MADVKTVGHTPTPWKTRAAHVYSHNANVCSMSDPHGSDYVEYTRLEIGSPDLEEAHANAAFIVKAVNSHDALVKALKFFADINNWKLGGQCDPNSGNFNAIQIANVALAKAGAA